MSRILVVDAYRGWRLGVCDVLREAGHDVWTASDGREALRLSAQIDDGLDLVLAEVELSDMPALDLYHRMRSADPGLRILFMTHAADSDPAVLLHKPCSLELLERAVEGALAAPPRRSITAALTAVSNE